MMNRSHLARWFPAAVTLGFLGSVGLARMVLAPSTWVVDAAGGGNFTDIPPAIAAAADGDLILIRSGSYSDFTLAKGLHLVGEPGVFAGDVTLAAVTGPVSLAEMRLDTLSIQGCDPTVVVDGVHVRGLGGVAIGSDDFAAGVEDCADVRFVDVLFEGAGFFYAHGGLGVLNSRVEVTSSSLQGGDGPDKNCQFGYAGYGGDGLLADGSSRVHTALSQVDGGDGGDIIAGWCSTGYGGEAGDGGVVLAGELIVTGGEYTGGDGGTAQPGSGMCARGGDGVWGVPGQATLRRSGATFVRGSGSGYCGTGKAVNIPNVKAKPADPTLERLGDPVVAPGKKVTLRVRGNPGAFTRLFLGSEPQVKQTGNTFLELLLVKETTVNLGFIPASGFVEHDLSLDPSAGYLPGTTLFAQAVTLYPGSDQRRTNSMPLVLR